MRAVSLALKSFWALLLILSTCPVQAAETSGAGSTFVTPLLRKWAENYDSATGDKVSYLSIGSGAGILQIKAHKVDFGASDMPLPPDELQKAGLAQFPIIIGGVVPVVNLVGVQSGQIKFTGQLLADIFLGKVQSWSDPAIVQLNPGLKLPNEKIVVVHRTDGSGTTFNWANFLALSSPEWRNKIGVGTGLFWPTGMGARGNEGVAASVRQIPNSIGYVEYTYVIQNNLVFGLVRNKTGKFVAPSQTSFKAAAANVDWNMAKQFYVTLTDAPGDDAFPITATTFALMPMAPSNPAQSDAVLRFFRWGLTKGDKAASELGYVPLPTTLVDQVQRYWKSQFHFGS